MSTVFQAQISGVNRLKDGTFKLTLETQEINKEQRSDLMDYQGLVKVLISDENIAKEVITAVDDLEISDNSNKTKSQRLKAVLFKLWEKEPSGFEDFTTFYRSRMERIINQIKERLD